MKTNKILLTFYPLISNYPFHNLCQYKKIPTLNSTFLSWYLKWVLTMAPPVGLEPTTHGLTVRRSTDWAKGECLCWHYLSSRQVTLQVLSARTSLTSVFGMGTGGPSSQSIPTYVVPCGDFMSKTFVCDLGKSIYLENWTLWFSATFESSLSLRFGQAFGLLVSVSSTPLSASTSDLSTT